MKWSIDKNCEYCSCDCGCSCRSEQLWEVEGMYSIWSSSRSIVFCVLDTSVSLHCEGTRDTVTTEPADLTWTEARLLLFVRFKDFAEKYRDCDNHDAFMCWLSGFEIGTLRPPMALPHHHNIVAKFRYSCIASSFVLPNFHYSYSLFCDVPVAWECSILIDKRHSSTFCHLISCHSSNSPKKGAATQTPVVERKFGV